jgi:SnoaL-like protein
VKRAFAAMERSDVEVVALFYEPDAEVLMEGMAAVGVNETYRGHDGIRAIYADVDEVFDDWRWIVRGLVDGGDRFAIRTDFSGHGRGSGAETVLNGGGTAIRLSERGLATWQAWYPEAGGWEKALGAVGLSDRV